MDGDTARLKVDSLNPKHFHVSVVIFTSTKDEVRLLPRLINNALINSKVQCEAGRTEKRTKTRIYP